MDYETGLKLFLRELDENILVTSLECNVLHVLFTDKETTVEKPDNQFSLLKESSLTTDTIKKTWEFLKILKF